jgi:hypothetical protein
MFLWANIIGLVGVFITLIAYFLLNIEKIKSNDYSYSMMNALGSVMILYSLFYAWNIAAFLMEVSWLLISLFGCYKAFHR